MGSVEQSVDVDAAGVQPADDRPADLGDVSSRHGMDRHLRVSSQVNGNARLEVYLFFRRACCLCCLTVASFVAR